ncbi:acetyl-CoA hydrolase/transferase C-terminal domain-containing protein [Longitalea arenae]|uniref:acetyl-CoA hydrolase/transferase C-terminal domain-containing protein n=1 Tax=Longitalea arenae TaxID=2812558 RepID=UPI0034E1D3AA
MAVSRFVKQIPEFCKKIRKWLNTINLFGKNLKQRGKALISIAHPDHQESLERSFYERYK